MTHLIYREVERIKLTPAICGVMLLIWRRDEVVNQLKLEKELRGCWFLVEGIRIEQETKR